MVPALQQTCNIICMFCVTVDDERLFVYDGAVSTLQLGLFAGGEPAVAVPPVAFERVDLGDGSWVDVARGWLAGADELAEHLAGAVAWRQRRRRMYDRVLDEPRLVRWYGAGDPLPHPALAEFRAGMADRYGVAFGDVGLNHYRDGADSVAWHADRELRRLADTLVAIVTLGASRPFLLRPAGGGRSLDLRPASGDVVVMGGACQLRWQHCVPKVASAGRRISASVRWAAPAA